VLLAAAEMLPYCAVAKVGGAIPLVSAGTVAAGGSLLPFLSDAGGAGMKVDGTMPLFAVESAARAGTLSQQPHSCPSLLSQS